METGAVGLNDMVKLFELARLQEHADDGAQ